MGLVDVEFYGGALKSVLPDGFMDASLVREVPDTQEVYVNARKVDQKYSDNLGYDESVIVDLMERVESVTEKEALDVHVEEISQLNGSGKWTELAYEKIDESSQRCIIVESLKKWGKDELQEVVVICVGLIRLKKYETDVVIAINVPLKERTKEMQGFDQTTVANSQPVSEGYRVLHEMITKFKVVDPSIFC